MTQTLFIFATDFTSQAWIEERIVDQRLVRASRGGWCLDNQSPVIEQCARSVASVSMQMHSKCYSQIHGAACEQSFKFGVCSLLFEPFKVVITYAEY